MPRVSGINRGVLARLVPSEAQGEEVFLAFSSFWRPPNSWLLALPPSSRPAPLSLTLFYCHVSLSLTKAGKLSAFKDHVIGLGLRDYPG